MHWGCPGKSWSVRTTTPIVIVLLEPATTTWGDPEAQFAEVVGTHVNARGTLILRGWVSVADAESVTFIVKVNRPVARAVPLTTPVALNVKPVGNVPDSTVQVKGPDPPESC